jgi:hypothetical protein
MALKIAVSPVTSDYSKSWVGTVGETSGTLVNVAVSRILTGVDFTTDVRILPITTTGSSPRVLVNSYDLSVPGDLGQAGSALYGIYDPSDSGTPPVPTNWGNPVRTAQCTSGAGHTVDENWTISNPYGIVTVGTTMYMIDYDNASDETVTPPDYTCHICSYNMASGAFSENSTPIYTFNPGMTGSTYYKGAGTGLDLYGNYLIATFSRYTNSGWTYNYGPSALVKINLTNNTVTTVALNANSNGVVVEGDYAYVVSYGGAQVAGGTTTSKLEVVSIDSTPSVLQTFTTGMSDTFLSGSTPSYTQGDYTDVAFVGGKAYVLLAQYNSAYTQYEYAIIQTTEGSLQGGDFDSNDSFKVDTVNPASPCFALLPGGDDTLYFVDGVNINTINVTGDIDATGAITPIVDAGDFVNGTDTGAMFNSAAVVIEKVATTLRGAPAKAHVTKMAKRLARPEDLERDKK